MDLHSALFALAPVAQPAVGRARYTDTVDLITSKRSKVIEGDRARAKKYLCEANKSLAAQLLPRRAHGPAMVATMAQGRWVLCR